MTDATTHSWTRNPADERAASRGARFNVERGSHAVWWIESICRLYEGEPDKPMALYGCRTCGHVEPNHGEWSDKKTKAALKARAEKYAKCMAAGHELDWQYEFVMRMFGWEKWSTDFNCWIRRFKRAGVWVAKKNKKTPTLAATALYVFCGDGEPGQKVYLCAKDGSQARIAGLHVMKMHEQSPLLSDECDSNKTLMQLTYLKNGSIIKPISSGDSKAQRSKEGLNGSVFVDEMHVVDSQFMSIVQYAGVSRKEPVHIGFSTAGDDPMGYGYGEFEYGQSVNSGEEDDDHYLFMGYFAPQNVSDQAVHADPIKYGKMANPAWGHTVRESEFMDSYKTAKATPVGWADFKKYRLNIWQKAAVVWLPVGSWEANERDYSEADLLGRDCYAALDLARTRDTSALALIFPEDDGTYKLLCYFWLPEITAQDRARDTKYQKWAQDGWVELTPGDVTDYAFIENRVNELRAKFNVRKLAFDVKFATELMQRIANAGMDVNDQHIFPQTLMEFAGPTALFERLVISQKLHHDGNPLLAWQAGNTHISKPDANGNIRPVKQKKGDIRTIDGVVASVMALGCAEKFKEQYTIGGVEAW